MQLTLEDERRGRHEPIERRGRARPAHRIPQETPRPQQPRIGRHHRPPRSTPLRRKRLRHQQTAGHQRRAAEHREQHVARPPVDIRRQKPADRRRDGRHHRHHQRQQRQLPRRLVRRRPIAHRRPPEHQPGAPANRLQDARRDQHRGVRRQRGHDTGAGEQRQPSQHNRPPAEPVGHRPIQQLPDRQPDQIQRDGQLRRADRHAQRPRRGGQRGNDDMHPECAAGSHRDQQQKRRPRAPAQRRGGQKSHGLSRCPSPPCPQEAPAATRSACPNTHLRRV